MATRTPRSHFTSSARCALLRGEDSCVRTAAERLKTSRPDFVTREKVAFLVNTTDTHTEYATLSADDPVVRKYQTPKLIP